MKKTLLLLMICLLSFVSSECFSQNDINLVLNNYGCYSEYGCSQTDANNIAAFGFKYVVYYAHGQPFEVIIPNFKYFQNAGLGIIVQITSLNYAMQLVPKLSNNPNIIGWYILDEVDVNKVSVADQNLIITKIKEISNLPIFGSANIDCFPNNRISFKYDYIFSEKQLLDIWSVKLKLYGKPGPFFIYNAGSTSPKMETMKTNSMLRNTAKTFITTNTIFKAPLMTANSVTDYSKPKSMSQHNGDVSLVKESEPFKKVIDISKSTTEIKYSIIPKVQAFGYFINSGEYLTLDFGKPTKFAQIFMLYFQSYGDVDGIFSFHRVIDDKHFVLEKIGANLIIKHGEPSGRKLASKIFENLNSRYLVIKSEMDERYNNYTAIEYLGYVTCTENPYAKF